MASIASTVGPWMAGRLSADGYRRRKAIQSAGAVFLPACLIVTTTVLPPLVLLSVAVAATVMVATYNFSLDVRRTHDFGMSGWWVGFAYATACGGGCLLTMNNGAVGIAAAAPLSLWLASTVFGLPLGWIGGQAGPNLYGPAPEPTRPISGEPWMRQLRELFFEPHGRGFVFYRTGWSPGVPVSAEEREEYLATSPYRLTTAAKRFAGRTPVTPPRPFLRTAWRRANCFPLYMQLVFLGSGWFWINLAFSVQEAALRWPMIVFGMLSVALAAMTMIAKMLPPRRSSEA